MSSYFRLVYFSYVHCADVTCQQQRQVNNPIWSLCMWMTLYTDTHRHPAESAAELRWRWLEAQHRQLPPFGSLSSDWTRCCAAQLRLQILRMQIKKISTGSKVWSSHIVEQSNDQGLETVFVSLRSSRLRQKTSCMALVDKVKHFNFCCIICEFLFFC